MKAVDPKLMHALPYVLVVVVAIGVSIPIFSGQVLFETGHDYWFHKARIEGIAAGIQAGDFPVKMQYNQSLGTGYPASVMYGDTFLYPAAALEIIGVSSADAWRILVVAINLGTGFIGFFCFKRMFGSAWLGALGASLWLLAPYRLERLYLSAALGEVLAMMMYPLIAYGLYSVFFSDRKGASSHGWIPLCLGVSGIVQSHIVSVASLPLLMLPILIVLLVIRHNLDVLKQLGLTVLFSFILSCWFVVPFADFYLTVPMVITESQVDLGFLDAARTHLSQLLQPVPQFWGQSNVHRLSLGDPSQAMGQTIGLLFYVVLASAVPVFLVALRRTAGGRALRQSLLVWGAVFASALLGLFLTSTLFTWSADYGVANALVKLLATIQYPFRILGFVSFLCCLLLCKQVSLLREDGFLRMSTAYAGGAIVLSVLIAVAALCTWPEMLNRTKHTALSMNGAVGEYYLEGMDAQSALDRAAEGVNANPEELSVTYVQTWAKAEVTIDDSAHVSEFEVDLPLIDYKYYEVASVNPQAVSATLAQSDDGYLRLVLADVPIDADELSVSVAFAPPWFWTLSYAVSGIGAVALCIAWGMRLRPSAHAGKRLRADGRDAQSGKGPRRDFGVDRSSVERNRRREGSGR